MIGHHSGGSTLLERDNDNELNAMALVGRVLLALMFLLAGIGKIGAALTAPSATSVPSGCPCRRSLAAGALVLEIVAGMALIIGYQDTLGGARAGALHAGRGVPVPQLLVDARAGQQMMQQIIFLKNLAVAGGLLMLACHGPGAWSVDRR